MKTRTTVDMKSLAALLLEWAVILTTITAAIRLQHWASWLLAALIIATRQHALLMLFHDAVHGLLARNRNLNDLLINIFVGVPHLVPVESYRPLHLAHHKTLGTESDPERMLLYAGQPWNYRPLEGRALLRQLCGDLFFVNGVRTLLALSRQQGLPMPRIAILLPVAAWLIGLAVVFAIWPTVLVPILALWFLPLFTVTNLLQKLRSFAEHSGGPGVTENWDDWTYSWRPGAFGRLTIWPYNINRHREHHREPAVPWHGLPAVADSSGPELPGRFLPSLLYRRS